MNTEKKSDRYNKIDVWETSDILHAILESQLNAIAVIENALHELENAVEKAIPLLAAGGRLIFAGAGTSGRLAVQECAELYPTFSWPKNKSLFLIAGGEKALTHAIENAEDDIEQAESEAKKLKLGRKDCVICLAASGRTPYTLGILREANRNGSLTIGVSSALSSPLLNEAQIKVFLNTGAEVIAGSTRMKAGTAQKAVLNMLTTTFMIKLHHVYDSYMIDVVASNAKLMTRCIDMVSQICKVDKETAKNALDKSKNIPKLACAYIKLKDIKLAEKMLAEHNGNLRKCLED